MGKAHEFHMHNLTMQRMQPHMQPLNNNGVIVSINFNDYYIHLWHNFASQYQSVNPLKQAPMNARR